MVHQQFNISISCLWNREDIDDEEYMEMKNETIEQLNEVRESLKKMDKGDISLIDDINAMQLVILSSKTYITNTLRNGSKTKIQTFPKILVKQL